MDPRIDTISVLVDQKKIETFGDIFRWVPRTRVAQEIDLSPYRMEHIILHPSDMTLGQMHQLADLFQLDREVMYGLLRHHIARVAKGGYEIPKLDYGGG